MNSLPRVNLDPSEHASHAQALGGGEPLTAEHYEALRDAKPRRAKIDRAIKMASFNGWSTGVFAALSVPFAFFSVSGLLICLGLGAVTYHEFKGRAMLRRLDLGAPKYLGMNQIGFGALIVVYCLWSMYTAMTGTSSFAEHIAADPALAQALGPVDDLYKTLSLVVYGAGAVLTLIYQAVVSRYYFSRLKHLREYLEQTPQWVTEVERAAA